MILADENMSASILEALAAHGFPVVRMADVDAGAPDTAVLAYALTHGLIVLTQDKDFGDLVHRDGAPHVGVVLVRLRGLTLAEQAAKIVAIFAEHGASLGQAFTVISGTGDRVRR